MDDIDAAARRHLDEAFSLVGIGNLFAAAWEYRRAMDTQRAALDDGTCAAWTTLSEGRFADALVLFKERAAETPADRCILMATAILERSHGDTYAGHPQLMKALALWPNDAALLHQIGNSYLIQDNRPEAAQYYERAVQLAPENVDYLFSLMNVLSDLGKYETALTYYPHALKVQDPYVRQWAIGFVGHARVATTVDREALRATLQEQESALTWSSTDQIWTLLREAIVHRRPFSLIRLGDGEGRFLFRDDPASAYSEKDRAEFADTAFLNWFARNSSEFAATERLDLRQRVAEAISNADCLGLPMWARVAVDRQCFGYLWALQTYIDSDAGIRQTRKANCFVNVELHKIDPFYGRLLEGCANVGVVSCHRELGAHLSRELNIAVESILIAGEQGQPNLPEAAREGRHYPEQYRSTLAKIAGSPAGTVWLVAAGLFGKIYCEEAKRNGSIAIDIGSLADAWMGHNTRAGHYEERDTYILGAAGK